MSQTNFSCKAVAAVKQLLANPNILLLLLKCYISEFKGCSEEVIRSCLPLPGDTLISSRPVFPPAESILTKCQEDDALGEGRVVYDIFFRTKLPQGESSGIFINIEAQNSPNPGYSLVNRATYYAGRLLSGQRGEEFFGSNYGQLKKVYSIWLVLSPSKSQRNTSFRIGLAPEAITGIPTLPGKEDYDKPELIFINIGDDGSSDDDFLSAISVLLSNKFDEDSRREYFNRRGNLLYKGIQKEVQEMCNYSEKIEQEGLSKGMAKMDGEIAATFNWLLSTEGPEAAITLMQSDLETRRACIERYKKTVAK